MTLESMGLSCCVTDPRAGLASSARASGLMRETTAPGTAGGSAELAPTSQASWSSQT